MCDKYKLRDNGDVICKSCIHYRYDPNSDWVDNCDDGFECDIHEAKSCRRYETEKVNKNTSYVFHVYKDNDDKVHIERLKIIYQNKTYVYAKKHGRDELYYEKKTAIYKSIDDIPNGQYDWRYMHEFVWDIPIEKTKMFAEVQRHRRIKKLKAMISDHNREIEKLEHQKDFLLKDIEDFNEELDMLEKEGVENGQ